MPKPYSPVTAEGAPLSVFTPTVCPLGPSFASLLSCRLGTMLPMPLCLAMALPSRPACPLPAFGFGSCGRRCTVCQGALRAAFFPCVGPPPAAFPLYVVVGVIWVPEWARCFTNARPPIVAPLLPGLLTGPTGGGGGSSVLVRDPPPLPALRAHLVAKGQ